MLTQKRTNIDIVLDQFCGVKTLTSLVEISDTRGLNGWIKDRLNKSTLGKPGSQYLLVPDHADVLVLRPGVTGRFFRWGFWQPSVSTFHCSLDPRPEDFTKRYGDRGGSKVEVTTCHHGNLSYSDKWGSDTFAFFCGGALGVRFHGIGWYQTWLSFLEMDQTWLFAWASLQTPRLVDILKIVLTQTTFRFSVEHRLPKVRVGGWKMLEFLDRLWVLAVETSLEVRFIFAGKNQQIGPHVSQQLLWCGMFRCNCTWMLLHKFLVSPKTCCFPWEWWWISRNRLQGLLTWVQVQVWTPFDAYLISCQILCCFIAMAYLVCFIMSQSSVSACLTEAVSVETWCLERGGTSFFSAKSPLTDGVTGW